MIRNYNISFSFRSFRYKPSSLPSYPTCTHLFGTFQCRQLTMKDIKLFHDRFYVRLDKIEQDAMILKYCNAVPVKRHRPTTNANEGKQFQKKYFISNADNKLIQVCANTFQTVLCIKRDRVDTVVKNFWKTGSYPTENRGGDYKSVNFKPKKMAVMNFIKRLKCDGSHYCRGSSSGRQYLSSDLNINKLYTMYNNQSPEELKVKRTYFFKIFSKNFNLGFGHPVTDACSTCIQLNLKITAEKNEDEKANLQAQKQIHKLRADAFYDLVREKVDEMVTFCFDCQKNLPMPKIPDQSCYYSRQLYLYNFTMTMGCSKDPLAGNTMCYTWTEDEFSKGSNEIASAIFHRLTNTNFEGKSVIRLIADGCCGQNKNTIVLTACSVWLAKYAPKNIESVELVFPVTGHSFIPPDRVFGNIEKKIRQIENILNPNQYLDIISQHGSVFKLGTDCEVADWKEAAKKVIKSTSTLHFKISECKRFFLKRRGENVAVRGEIVYRHNMGSYKLITKKNCNLQDVNPCILEKYSNKVKQEKADDVKTLLQKHFGDQWELNEELEYYKTFYERNRIEEEKIEDVIGEFCEPRNETTELIV